MKADSIERASARALSRRSLEPRNLVRHLAVVSLLCGCVDVFDVQDPQRFTDDDLDAAPQAVANGVEGMFHAAFDYAIILDALLSDTWQNTGTWGVWRDVDRGTVRFAQSTLGDFVFDQLLRTRFAAIDAQQRFERLRTEGSDLAAAMDIQVKTVDGLVDLLVAEMYCEAPGQPGGVGVSDSELLQQALEKLRAVNADADDANLEGYRLLTRAAMARTHLLLGNLTPAAEAAAQVPTEFSYRAIYSREGQTNDIVTLATFGSNHAGGMREKWWSQVDVGELSLLDPFTGEPDPRMPIKHEPGVLGADGVTPFYSQWKYTDETDDIEIIGGTEMRLIEAEVRWANGEYQPAVDILNALRAAAGLSAYTSPVTRDGVLTLLLHERFAERFLEGGRANDLHRFGLLTEMVSSGHFDSPTVGHTSIPARAVKFPVSQEEALHNPNIENDVSLRCSPTL